MTDPLLTIFSVAIYWLVILSPLIATSYFAALRGKLGQPVLKPSLMLLAPTIPWALLFAHASLNRWEDVSNPTDVSPAVGAVSIVVVYGTPVLAAVAVLLAKGYRGWALLVGVLNTVVAIATAFLGIMMISGNWI